MFRIVGSLPIRTRLPLEAWALAGLVALFSLVSSLLRFFLATWFIIQSPSCQRFASSQVRKKPMSPGRPAGQSTIIAFRP